MFGSTGRARRWYVRMASRAGASGGRTSSIRSNLPGRRSASRHPRAHSSHRGRRPLRCRPTRYPFHSAVAQPRSATSVGGARSFAFDQGHRLHRGTARTVPSFSRSRTGALKIPLTLPEVHVQDVAETDRDEPCAHLAGRCASDECLATSGRSEQEETATQRLSVQLSELRVSHRRKECHFQASFDLIHAANIGQLDVRNLDVVDVVRIPCVQTLG